MAAEKIKLKGVRLLSLAEVAAILGLSPKSLYNRSGFRAKEPLPFKTVRVGRRVLVKSTDLERFIESL